MPQERSEVKLTQKDRAVLEEFVAHGKKSARAINRARILLLAAEGRTDTALTQLLGVSRGTVYNVRKKNHLVHYTLTLPTQDWQSMIDRVFVHPQQPPSRADTQAFRQGRRTVQIGVGVSADTSIGCTRTGRH